MLTDAEYIAIWEYLWNTVGFTDIDAWLERWTNAV